jgi:hypothetical protein
MRAAECFSESFAAWAQLAPLGESSGRADASAPEAWPHASRGMLQRVVRCGGAARCPFNAARGSFLRSSGRLLGVPRQ